METMGPQLAEFFGVPGAGVLVHSVDADSPAAKAGLHAGDVVVRANSVKMASSSDWMKIVRENRGKSVEVVVLRDKKEQTLTLVPDGKKRSSVDYPADRETAIAEARAQVQDCDFISDGCAADSIEVESATELESRTEEKTK